MNYGGKPVSLVDLFSLVLHYAEEKVAAGAGDLGVDTLQSKLQQWRTLEERKLESKPSLDCRGFLEVHCVHTYTSTYTF